MNHSNDIIQTFEHILNEKKCHELCRQHKFIERSTSKLEGHEFIKTLILPSEGISTDSLAGLCKRIKEFNPKADLSAQALCDRINDASSGKLMKGVFGQLIFHACSKTIHRCSKLSATLVNFNSVIIEDSTVAQLNEQLNDTFEGTNRGGTVSKAQIKIDLIYDIMKGLIVDAEMYSGKVPDQALAERIINYLKPGDLLIRDLGYFVLRTFKAIAEKGAYVLTRLQPNVNIYLRQEDTEPLELGKYIQKHFSQLNIIEMKVYVGNEKVPFRLIAYHQPQDIVDKRLREANKTAKAKGYTMGKNKRLSLKFAMFVTNVPAEMLSAEIVGTIYRLRWEIELIFKRWKGQLEIDYLKGINKNRIYCLIWSRMCMVVIMEIISGYIANIVQKKYERELSDAKLIAYLLRSSAFCTAIRTNKLESFLEEMERDIPRRLLKDKRRRQTMRGRVFANESYYLIQEVENQMFA